MVTMRFVPELSAIARVSPISLKNESEIPKLSECSSVKLRSYTVTVLSEYLTEIGKPFTRKKVYSEINSSSVEITAEDISIVERSVS